LEPILASADGQAIYDPPLPPVPTAAEIADKTKNQPPRPTTKG
jgi:hypothetical protein